MEELTGEKQERVDLNNDESELTTPTADPNANNDVSNPSEQAKRDSKADTGKMLQTVGALLSLTIVGAIIGVPVVLIGMKMEADAEGHSE